MEKNQIKAVIQIQKKDENLPIYKHHRQIPVFFVTAYCFSTAKSLVKEIFKGQNVVGQLEDSKGRVENIEF